MKPLWKRLNLKGIKFKGLDWGPIKRKKGLRFYILLSALILLFLVVAYVALYVNYRLSSDVRRGEPAFPSRVSESLKLKAPRVAIILDDAGGEGPNYREIFSIKEPLTISILPHLPESESVAIGALISGKEVMLHLPMEPHNGSYVRNDGSMVLTSMSDEEIERIVYSDLGAVFGASGINNHMGSKATEDKRVMDAVLRVIKRKDLYFVDSRTSRRSVAYTRAKRKGIKSAANNMFVDVAGTKKDIEKALEGLVLRAKRVGYAVGIGHVTRAETIEVLKELMPYYERNGIKFVFASEVVN